MEYEVGAAGVYLIRLACVVVEQHYYVITPSP